MSVTQARISENYNNPVRLIAQNNQEAQKDKISTTFAAFLEECLSMWSQGDMTDNDLYEEVTTFINKTKVSKVDVERLPVVLRDPELNGHYARNNLQEIPTDATRPSMRIRPNMSGEALTTLRRPNVSGEALNLLQEWCRENLSISEVCVGELTSNLYTDYREYLSQVKRIEIASPTGINSYLSKESVISRKKFNESFLYVQQIINKNTFITLNRSRKTSITGVELKRSKIESIPSQKLKKTV